MCQFEKDYTFAACCRDVEQPEQRWIPDCVSQVKKLLASKLNVTQLVGHRKHYVHHLYRN